MVGWCLDKKSSYFLTEKIMTWTLDHLPSYKFVIRFRELEKMNLSQAPPTILLDVTHPLVR